MMWIAIAASCVLQDDRAAAELLKRLEERAARASSADSLPRCSFSARSTE